MTLNEAKALLSKNSISFELCEFQNEAEYLHHAMLFPNTANAKHCKVISIIIRSKNEKKNIELQFNAVDDISRFEELWFGDYCYEIISLLFIFTFYSSLYFSNAAAKPLLLYLEVFFSSIHFSACF